MGRIYHEIYLPFEHILRYRLTDDVIFSSSDILLKCAYSSVERQQGKVKDMVVEGDTNEDIRRYICWY
ncbi:hypothetical protein B5X24_HaOG202871 [Helicoverpa armigera]|nr:hypothetical protein B5X24_HaOG202871 [Helicoverpa armigera]